MAKTLLSLLMAIFAAGCGSSYVVSSSPDDSSFSEFNRSVYGKQGYVTLERNSVPLWAVGMVAKSDSLFWMDEAGVGKSAAAGQVKEVTFTNSSAGTWEGIGLGFLAGGGIAAGVTAAIFKEEAGWGYILFVPAGALVGTVVGAIVGGSVGHTYSYTFHR